MIFNVKFMTLASLFVVVVSQTPPECVLYCSEGALTSVTNTSCKSFADPCVCTDKGFQTADAACLKSTCSAADQATALQLQQSFCGGASNTTDTASSTMTSASATTYTSMQSTMSGSMSGNMTSMTATSSSSGGYSSGTSSSSSSASSPSKSSGAGPQAEFGLFTVGVAAAGAVVGGLLL